MDLIVTSGGLGPTADDLTAEVVGRFAGREMVLDEEMEEKIARSSPASPTAQLRPRGAPRRTASRRWSRRAPTLIDPAGTAPGLVVPVDEGPVVIVMPGPAARAPRDVADRRLRPSRSAPILDRAEPYAGVMLRLFGVPESEIAKSLREIEEEVDPRRSRSRPACARASSRSRSAIGPAPRTRAQLDRRHRRAPRTLPLQPRRRDDRLAARGAAQGHRIATAESCTGGMLAARLTEPPARPHTSAAARSPTRTSRRRRSWASRPS